MMKRLILLALLALMLFPQSALAQTVLPGNSDGFEIHEQNYNGLSPAEKKTLRKERGIQNACGYWFDTIVYRNTTGGQQDLRQYIQNLSSDDIRRDVLSCAIKTGDLHLWMLPLYIAYIANFFIGIAGTVSLLFVLLGGFWYMTGGITDDKEKGKKTITYALIGLAITLLAWLLVNIIQVAIT